MKKKKEIAMLLSNGFAPDPRVYKEAKTLVQNDYNVTIFCLDRNCNLPKKEITNGINIRRFRVGKVPTSNILKTPIALFKFKNLVSKELKKENFDIIHSHDLDTALWGYYLSKKIGSKFIFDCHDLYHTQLPSGNIFFKCLKKLTEILGLYIAKKSDLLITVTERLGRKEEGFKEYFIQNNISKSKILVLWNYPTRLKKYPQTDSNYLRISFIGNIRDIEGFKKLLNAISGIGEININIYGAGHKLGVLAKLCKQKNVKFNYFGKIPYSEIGKAYANTDIVFSMYNTKRENIKKTIAVKTFEAAYFKVPVLADKNTLNGEFVEKNDIGLAVQSEGEIINAINKIREGKVKITNKNFIWEEQEEKLLNMYDKI